MKTDINNWITLTGIALLAFAIGIDLTSISIALPQIQYHISGSLGITVWIQYAYLLTIVIFLPPINRLSHSLTTRKLLLIGGGCFVFGVMIIEFSSYMSFLIFARIIQGFGTAALIPAMLTWLEEFQSQANIKSRWFETMTTLGLAVGPLVSAIYIQDNQFDNIDNMTFKISLLGFLLCFATDRKQRKLQHIHLDTLGILTLGIALFAMLLALTKGPSWGWGSVFVNVGFLIAIGSGGFFVYHTLSHKDPIYNLNYVKTPMLFNRALAAFVTGWFLAVLLMGIPLFANDALQRLHYVVAMCMLCLTVPQFISFHLLKFDPDIMPMRFRVTASYIGFIITALLLTQVSRSSSLVYMGIALIPAGLSWGINMKLITDSKQEGSKEAINAFSTLLISLATLGALIGSAMTITYFRSVEKSVTLAAISSGKIILPVDLSGKSEGLVQMIFNIGDVDLLAEHMDYALVYKIMPIVREASAVAFQNTLWMMFFSAVAAYGVTILVRKVWKL